MKRRMEVTEEEAAILAGLRHERDIWNKALEAAATHLVDLNWNGANREVVINKILELRKS